MKAFLVRNKRTFAMAGVFLLAMVIAHLAKKSDAAAAGSDLFGPSPPIELVDRSASAAPVVIKQPTRPTRRPRGIRYTEVEVTESGTIRGVARLDKAVELWTVAHDKDGDKGCHGGPQATERVIVGLDGLTLANCVVYLEDIEKGKAWTDEFAKDEDTRSAILDQKGCRYIPHILPIRVKTQVGLKNSDVAEHNVHTYDASGRTGVNQMTPGNAFLPEVAAAYIEKPGPYSVKCDIHPWMSGYIWAFAHPYWAVTGKDGAFEISNVPPGEYTLVCWHEGMKERAESVGGGSLSYTYGKDFVTRVKITVTAGGTVTQDFTVPAPTPPAPK